MPIFSEGYVKYFMEIWTVMIEKERRSGHHAVEVRGRCVPGQRGK